MKEYFGECIDCPKCRTSIGLTIIHEWHNGIFDGYKLNVNKLDEAHVTTRKIEPKGGAS